MIRPAIGKYSNSIYFEFAKPVNAVADYSLTIPAHQQKGCGSIHEIVFGRTLPNEMPAIVWIDAQHAWAFAFNYLKRTVVDTFKIAPAKFYRIRIITWLGRHKADAENTPVGRVTEAVGYQGVSLADLVEAAGDADAGKRVPVGRP